MNEQIDPIPQQEARKILQAAIRERLGEGWEEEADGWTLVTGHDYMARFNKGHQNIDFYVDILGNVTIEENATNPGQNFGRQLAWLLLGLSLIIAYLIASAAGFL